MDGGAEDPFAVLALEVLFGHGVFFQEEALGAGVQFENDLLVEFTGHAEDVGLPDLVFVGMGPGRVQDLHGVDAHDLIDPAVLLVHVVGPDVYHVGREGKRLHQPVPGVIAVGRFVATQDYLLLVLDGVVQRLDVGGNGRIIDIVGDAGSVIDTGQLSLQVPRQHIVIVDAFNQLGGHVGLLLGEVDKPIEVAQSPVKRLKTHRVDNHENESTTLLLIISLLLLQTTQLIQITCRNHA